MPASESPSGVSYNGYTGQVGYGPGFNPYADTASPSFMPSVYGPVPPIQPIVPASGIGGTAGLGMIPGMVPAMNGWLAPPAIRPPTGMGPGGSLRPGLPIMEELTSFDMPVGHWSQGGSWAGSSGHWGGGDWGGGSWSNGGDWAPASPGVPSGLQFFGAEAGGAVGGPTISLHAPSMQTSMEQNAPESHGMPGGQGQIQYFPLMAGFAPGFPPPAGGWHVPGIGGISLPGSSSSLNLGAPYQVPPAGQQVQMPTPSGGWTPVVAGPGGGAVPAMTGTPTVAAPAPAGPSVNLGSPYTPPPPGQQISMPGPGGTWTPTVWVNGQGWVPASQAGWVGGAPINLGGGSMPSATRVLPGVQLPGQQTVVVPGIANVPPGGQAPAIGPLNPGGVEPGASLGQGTIPTQRPNPGSPSWPLPQTPPTSSGWGSAIMTGAGAASRWIPGLGLAAWAGETIAQTFWPEEDNLGSYQSIRFGPPANAPTAIGVIGSASGWQSLAQAQAQAQATQALQQQQAAQALQQQAAAQAAFFQQVTASLAQAQTQAAAFAVQDAYQALYQAETHGTPQAISQAQAAYTAAVTNYERISGGGVVGGSTPWIPAAFDN